MGARRKFDREARHAAAFLLCLVVSFASSACGNKEGVSAVRNGQSADPAVGTTSVLLPGGASCEIVIDPLIPARSTPPGISVKAAPGRAIEVAGVQWMVNGSDIGAGTRLQPSAFRRGDRIQASVTLKEDGRETTITTREVIAGNSPPVSTGVKVDPPNPVSGGTVRAVAETADPDGDPVNVRFEWYVNGARVPGDTETLTLKDAKRGDRIHAKAIPNDGAADGGWCESPGYEVVNGLPVVKSEVPKELPPGRNFLYRIDAADPDGDPLTFSLKNGPPGAVLAGSTLEWKVPEDRIGAPVEFTIEISDGKGGTTVQNISMTVQPPRKP